ncbi:MAG: hypothetical protein C0606_10050 [Hyphomicrobiales bacterium]|nr:MAG: hypothetical protein C0606_10050 [Hyphomicrobiales bacterium]
MAQSDGNTPAVRPKDPEIRTIEVKDIGEVLAAGFRDFQAAPMYGIFFGGIYAIGGMAILLTAFAFGMGYLSYPLAAGFALIGPFIATGLYEVSRRRQVGEPLGFGSVIGVIFQQSRRELSWMAFVTIFLLIIYMYQVRLLLAIFLGLKSFTSMEEFIDVLVSTPEGLLFLLVANSIGFIVSFVLFALTVVSFPLLLDRDIDFVTAMITSVRAVMANPRAMFVWAATIFFYLVVAMLPAFLGLIVVLPVLGHATWHLYCRVVVREES